MEPTNSIPENADLVKIAVACRAIIREMRKQGRSFEAIAQEITLQSAPVSVSALQTFLQRDEGTRVNKANETFRAVYNYIRKSRHTQSPAVRAKITELWHLLSGNSPESEYTDENQKSFVNITTAGLFANWLHISGLEVLRVYTKLVGRYIMLRKSIRDENLIVRSLVTIEFIENEKQYGAGALLATHKHYDVYMRPRVSKGFLLPVVRNIYFLMNVEDGEGLEFIALKEPVQSDFKRMLGFITTMNTDRKLLSSHVCLERETENWSEFQSPRFSFDDKCPNWLANEKGEILSLLDPKTSGVVPEIPFSLSSERPSFK